MWIFSQLFRSSKQARGPASPRASRGGFTLIELLVVMAIMVILTTVLLLRQSKFDSSTLLRSLGYSVALSVRQAQVYGSSVFGTTTSSSAYCNTGIYQNGSCFATGYGIYVSSGSPTSYILFADLNSNGTYDIGEDVKVFTLNNGYVISNFCATDLNNNVSCLSGGTPVPNVLSGGNLSIIFKRPNPEACFTTNISPNLCAPTPSGTPYTSASIQIQLTGGDAGSTRSIRMNTTGQIIVDVPGS